MIWTTTCGASMALSSEPLDVPPPAEKQLPDEQTDHAFGRSHGGLSTLFHILCYGFCHPLNFHLTAGHVHETTTLVP